MARHLLAVFFLATLGLSCRDRAENTPSDSPKLLTVEPLSSLPPGLTLRLTPNPQRSELQVEVHLVGADAAAVKELAIAKDWAGIDGFATIRDLRLRDARGEIAVRPGPDVGPDRTLVLERPAVHEHLEARYRVLSAPANAPRFALHLDRERFSGVGHTFLLLPRLDKPLPVHLQIHSSTLAPGASGASSFGGGDEIETSATPREVAHAVYASGRLRSIARPNAGRLLLVGRPNFDPGAAHESIARAHHALEELFGGAPRQAAPRSFAYVVMTEPGLQGHDGTLLGRSFGLWMGSDAAFNAEMIIAATHELAHSWMGGAIRLVNERGEEQTWFSEGFAVHYARKIALAEKLVTQEEFAADLERTLGAGFPDLASHGITRSREAYQRGALYAASLDTAKKKASKGKRSLDDLLRSLLAMAVAKQTNRLPVTVFRELLVEELGAARGEELSWVMVEGHGELRVEDDAFGKCFYRAKTQKKVLQLGFDEAATLRAPQMIRGLVPGSAAARAGLVEGALVLSSKLHAEFASDWEKPVEVVIATPKGSKKIRYSPVAEVEKMHWAAKKGCVE